LWQPYKVSTLVDFCSLWWLTDGTGFLDCFRATLWRQYLLRYSWGAVTYLNFDSII
ncbi:hypothetical protein L9F63_021387, partial [Diploptera punctata]